MFVTSHSHRCTKTKHFQQKLIEMFEKQLDDHESKYGIAIPDRRVYLDVPWPKNVLQHVLSAYHHRTSFIGSLSRSRTSLNLVMSSNNTPNMDRRRSISPNADFRETKSAASSATNTTKRGKLTKAQRYGSTSNLKLVSEKISGFSVFNGSPIMAYGEVPIETVQKIEEEPKKTFERSKPVERMPISMRNSKKINRQSLSEHMFKQINEEPTMKRSISQQSLKQDIAMEAVMIDMPSLEGKYDTYKSGTSTIRSGTSTGSDEEKTFSRWGAVRGSNSYSDTPNVPVSQLSTLNLKEIATDKSKEPPDSVV